MNYDHFKPLEERATARAAQLGMSVRAFADYQRRLRADYKERMRVSWCRPLRVMRPWMVLPWVVRHDR